MRLRQEEPPDNPQEGSMHHFSEQTWSQIPLDEPSMRLDPSFITLVLNHIAMAWNDPLNIPLRYSLNITPHQRIIHAGNPVHKPLKPDRSRMRPLSKLPGKNSLFCRRRCVLLCHAY
jgi:hypothetical protein